LQSRLEGETSEGEIERWGKGGKEKEEQRAREKEFCVAKRLLFRSPDFYRVIETPSTAHRDKFHFAPATSLAYP